MPTISFGNMQKGQHGLRILHSFLAQCGCQQVCTQWKWNDLVILPSKLSAWSSHISIPSIPEKYNLNTEYNLYYDLILLF
jgi:hypothetical protein